MQAEQRPMVATNDAVSRMINMSTPWWLFYSDYWRPRVLDFKEGCVKLARCFPERFAKPPTPLKCGDAVGGGGLEVLEQAERM